jgi:hypothetical protein
MSNLTGCKVVELPQSGWQTDEFLAAVFGMEPDTFRRHCKNKQVRSEPFGNRTLYLIDDFLQKVTNGSQAQGE